MNYLATFGAEHSGWKIFLKQRMKKSQNKTKKLKSGVIKFNELVLELLYKSNKTLVFVGLVIDIRMAVITCE